MDALSQLLDLHPVRGALELRCEFDAPWRAEHTTYAPGVVPYHVMLAGEARLELSGQPAVPLRAGDVLLLPRGQAHRLSFGDAEAPPATPRRSPGPAALTQVRAEGGGAHTELLCGEFRLDREAASLLAGLPDVLLARAEGASAPALQALVGLLRDETAQDRPGAAAVVSHLASSLFALVLRAWLAQADAPPGLLGLIGDARLSPVSRRMLAEPQADWSVDALAALANMSRATFVRRFRAAAGASPGDVLAAIRMTHAAQALRQGRGLGDVAEAVGYASEAAFQRAFRRHWGEAPGAYRRRARAVQDDAGRGARS